MQEGCLLKKVCSRATNAWADRSKWFGTYEANTWETTIESGTRHFCGPRSIRIDSPERQSTREKEEKELGSSPKDTVLPCSHFTR